MLFRSTDIGGCRLPGVAELQSSGKAVTPLNPCAVSPVSLVEILKCWLQFFFNAAKNKYLCIFKMPVWCSWEWGLLW